MAKRYGFVGGKIPTAFTTTHFLRDLFHLDVTADDIAGIAVAGLLEQAQDGICITRWSSYQIDPTSQQRKERFRERGTDPERTRNGPGTVPPVPGTDSPVPGTARNALTGTGTGTEDPEKNQVTGGEAAARSLAEGPEPDRARSPYTGPEPRQRAGAVPPPAPPGGARSGALPPDSQISPGAGSNGRGRPAGGNPNIPSQEVADFLDRFRSEPDTPPPPRPTTQRPDEAQLLAEVRGLGQVLVARADASRFADPSKPPPAPEKREATRAARLDADRKRDW